MTFLGWLTIFGFAAILTALALPLGRYMAAVYTGERTFLDRVFGAPERLVYRVLRVDPERGQDWKAYARSLIFFSLAGWLLLYFILRTQRLWDWTGLNPQGFHSAPWNVTFNTTSSFVTNTNWQYYSGETTMSYFSQMVGLTVQNFVSAAVGISVAVALIRGIISRSGQEPWQFLAGFGPHGAVRAVADLVCGRAGAGVPGLDPEFRSLPDGAYGDRRFAVDRAGSGGFAGGDQGARDQRRRVL